MKDELNWSKDDKVNEFDDDALIEDDGYDADFDDSNLEDAIKAGYDADAYDAEDVETAAYAEDYNVALQSMWELRNSIDELDCIQGCEEVTCLEDTVGYNLILEDCAEYTSMLTLRMHDNKCYVYKMSYEHVWDMEVDTVEKPIHVFSLTDKFEISGFIDFVVEYCKTREEWMKRSEAKA